MATTTNDSVGNVRNGCPLSERRHRSNGDCLVRVHYRYYNHGYYGHHYYAPRYYYYGDRHYDHGYYYGHRHYDHGYYGHSRYYYGPRYWYYYH